VRSVHLLERRGVSVMWLNRAKQPTYLHDSKDDEGMSYCVTGLDTFDLGQDQCVLCSMKQLDRLVVTEILDVAHRLKLVNSFRTYHSRFSHFPVTSEDGGG
jgi:hypothetical protein